MAGVIPARRPPHRAGQEVSHAVLRGPVAPRVEGQMRTTGSRAGGPVRVLIVDDQPEFRKVARELLMWRGYAVVGELGCAAGVLDAVERLAPDGVLLDVRLGDDNGYSVARALARCDPAPGVLLVSLTDSGTEDALARACGACGFLAKERLATADLSHYWPAPAR
jgi:CheY-like chemotaxis protein